MDTLRFAGSLSTNRVCASTGDDQEPTTAPAAHKISKDQHPRSPNRCCTNNPHPRAESESTAIKLPLNNSEYSTGLVLRRDSRKDTARLIYKTINATPGGSGGLVMSVAKTTTRSRANAMTALIDDCITVVTVVGGGD